MNLERLLQSSVREVANRGAQEARKWVERSLGNASSPRLESRSPDIEEAVNAFQLLAAAGHSDRFFAGALEPGTPALLRETCPRAESEVVEMVDRCSHGRFDLLGYRALDFGNPIDWHFDPLSGRIAPEVHFSALDPLDREQVGDSKVIWELNRHQWWVAFAQEHAFSSDDRLVERLLRCAHDWRRANPPSQGINWASSLEAALRIVSWCWSLFLIRDSAALRADHLAQMIASLREHALHVERYLSYTFSPNTHLTGEALGLFYAGTAFPELREAGRWRELGARILTEQLERQVLADGVHFEQATCYQRYTVEIYLHYLVLAECSGWPVGEEVPAQVERMLDFLLAVRRPDGTLPQIGDSDGGCLLPLARRAVGDVRGIFSTAAAWFHRPDYAWAAGGIAPETLWLLGTKGLHAFSGLEPAPPAGPASRCFPEGGYAILRDAWDGGHQLILDGGPLGCPVSGAHGHADLLGLQCSAFGEPVIVDPGTGCYQGEPGWRDAFRSTSFHSTVTLDGLEQATPAGLFGWKERPTARLSNWQPGVEVEVAEALHDAWLGLPDPVQHRRRVFFLHRRFWVVVDDLAGSAEHDVQLRFQFAPIFVSQAPDGWMRARTSSGRGLFIRAFSLAPLEADIVEGRRDPPLGWVSDNYGHWQPAPQLIYRAAARLPLRIATVLFPAPEGGAHSPPVRPLFSAGGDLEGLACGEAAEEIRFDSATQKPADPPRVEEEKK